MTEHPYITESGNANPLSGFERIVLSGKFESQRVSFDFTMGSRHIDGKLPIHRFHADPGQLDAARAIEICKYALDAFVLAFDPMIATLSTNAIRGVERKRPWEIKSGYHVWISHLVGEVQPNSDAFTVEALGNGRKFMLPDDSPPKEVVSAWNSLLNANNISEVDEYIVQPMEIQLPPEDDPGPVPDSVRVADESMYTEEEANPVTAEDYRQQITGWLPTDDGKIPNYVVRSGTPAGLPVRYEGRTLRGPDGEKTEVMLTSIFHVDHLATDPMSELSALTAADLLSIASWQIDALPQGARLEWHCDTSPGATAVRNLLAVNALTAINVVHTPAIGAVDA